MDVLFFYQHTVYRYHRGNYFHTGAYVHTGFSCWHNAMETLSVLLGPLWKTTGHIIAMMKSSNGNIFRVTGPLWGNPPVTGGFPSQRLVTRNSDIFFDLHQNRQTTEHTIEGPAIWDAIVLTITSINETWIESTHWSWRNVFSTKKRLHYLGNVFSHTLRPS